MVRWRWTLGTAAMAAVAACGSGGGGDGPDMLHQQALDALARYDRAVLDAGGMPVLVPVGSLTAQLGDWEPANGDNKQALSSGRILATELPAAPSSTGRVTWDDGTTRTVALISAREALRQLTAAGTGDCPGCVPLRVTGARLTTTRIETTRGPATAPAWEYALKGTAVRVTRVAVPDSATVAVTPPPWDPEHPRGGIAIESARTSPPGTRLTVDFTGAPDPAGRPCGADYTAQAVESADAVVVIVLEHRHAADEACRSIGARRTATVDLNRPLGERAVLEVQQGLPVPLRVTG